MAPLLEPVEISSLAEDERNCSICLKAFESSESKGLEGPCKTACGHIFGSDCIRKWIETEVSCSVCRHDLVALDTPDYVAEPDLEEGTTPWWLTAIRGY